MEGLLNINKAAAGAKAGGPPGNLADLLGPEFAGMDTHGLKQQADNLWKFLDDLAENDPDAYKGFLEKQASLAKTEAGPSLVQGQMPDAVIEARVVGQDGKPAQQVALINLWAAHAGAQNVYVHARACLCVGGREGRGFGCSLLPLRSTHVHTQSPPPPMHTSRRHGPGTHYLPRPCHPHHNSVGQHTRRITLPSTRIHSQCSCMHTRPRPMGYTHSHTHTRRRQGAGSHHIPRPSHTRHYLLVWLPPPPHGSAQDNQRQGPIGCYCPPIPLRSAPFGNSDGRCVCVCVCVCVCNCVCVCVCVPWP